MTIVVEAAGMPPPSMASSRAMPLETRPPETAASRLGCANSASMRG